MEKLNFGTRRLVACKYSLLLAVPPVWARSRGLEPGDSVALTLDEQGDLIVKPATEAAP